MFKPFVLSSALLMGAASLAAAAPPAALPHDGPGHGLLQLAQGGATIRGVQQLLNQLGYNAGSADGVIGARTRAAISAFQRDQGLPVTGQATVQLYSQLQAALGGGVAPQVPIQPVAPAATISTGLISNVQAALRQRGYDIPVVSGVLDAQTQAAIRTYQADVGLPATGQVSQSLLTSLQAGSTQPSQAALQQRQLVQQIQAELNRRGYDAGPADGALGPKTRTAISTYQADAGLQVTGQASPSLLASLQASTQVAAPTQPTQPTTPANTEAQQQAQIVLGLEDELNQRGYTPGTVDGVFDAQTSAAIRAFQRDAGLSVTGAASAELLTMMRSSNIVARQVPQTPEDVAGQLLQGVTNEIFGRIQGQ